MTEAWPWFALAGLGAFHGLNPAMGWLFAVALGLHRRSHATVVLALAPIALGHALATAMAAALFLAVGYILDPAALCTAAGLGLIAWGFFHWRYGHRHRVRFGLQVGLLGLAAWSFLMATAHGAGLMLWPALMPLCESSAATAGQAASWGVALAGVGVHAAAMLAVTGAMALAIYAWIGVGVLRVAWLNVDLLWTLALMTAGAWLLVAV